MATLGDKNQSTALHAFNAKALWTHELEALLLDGTLDLIVHSLKDMPTQLPGGCCLGSVLARADRRDVVVMSQRLAGRGVRRLAELEPGAVVGTSSVRRAAQVRRGFPGVPIGVETEWEAEAEAEAGEGAGDGKAGDGEAGDGNAGDGKAGDVLVMRAIVLSVDGTEAVEGERRQRVRDMQEADECGWKMAQELVEKGAGKILEKIMLNRAVIQEQDGA
ncbi:MAG: Porphobilinogen deaminase [Lasallia pustulata]|uniref:hydroxymethylbilane synthase n=1 Tax=Lasallia pustulata TaxID=136370 RepID=A0A5M8PI34_9LECA|nr:MAG: Porphobilinogen deaminase [Lasallia pustulata]